MSERIILCENAERDLPCGVCHGKGTHHRDCPVPVLGVYEPPQPATGDENGEGA